MARAKIRKEPDLLAVLDDPLDGPTAARDAAPDDGPAETVGGRSGPDDGPDGAAGPGPDDGPAPGDNPTRRPRIGR